MMLGYHIGDFDDARGPATFLKFFFYKIKFFFGSAGVCSKIFGFVSAW